IRIETAKGLSEEQLQPFANQIGLMKPQPVPDLPKVDPLEHRGAVASDYKMTAAVSPEDNKSATSFAAALGLIPSLGSAVLNRLAEVEPRVSAMSLSEYGTWLAAQERQLGSPEEAKAWRADARRAITELGAAHPWSKVDAAALQDAWVIRTLATRF